MENTNPIHLQLEISAGDVTDEDLDQMARQLLAELKELEVESAELAKRGPAPAGSKSIDPITTGTIAVAILPAVLPKLVDFVQAWALRGNNRTVKFKGKVAGQAVEFEGSADDLQKLLATLSGRKKR